MLFDLEVPSQALFQAKLPHGPSMALIPPAGCPHYCQLVLTTARSLNRLEHCPDVARVEQDSPQRPEQHFLYHRPDVADQNI